MPDAFALRPRSGRRGLGGAPGRGRRSRPAALLAVLLLPAVAACGQVDAGGQAAEQTLTVFAAASLTEAFEELGERFEREHPGVAVEFGFAGSSDLAAQINQGAPADVYASADPATMDLVVEAGGVDGEPEVFARNTLEIAVPADNPAGVTGLADLGADGATVALCAEEVPCGAAARKVMDAAGGVEITPATYEDDVKAALTKVELGEVDAALVYRTDVIAAGDAVEGIGFPEAESAVNDYPIAVLREAPQPGPAAEWVELVRSGEGAQVLGDAGFTTTA